MSFYPQPIEAIVLAGTDSNPKRMILGENKAFLEVGGVPLVRGVVDALLQAESIGDVFVVGPADRLETVLTDLGETVHVVEQAGQMLSNSWAAIHAIEAHRGEQAAERPMLIISCDLPLISGAAVDDFVERCAQDDEAASTPFAMMTGVAEEKSLQPYYPGEQGRGVIRPYVNLDRFRVRLANIYVGRPRLLTNNAFLGTGFTYRKAKDWHNVIALVWKFLGQHGGFKAAWLAMKLQITLLASKRQGWLYRKLRKANTQERVEAVCSRVLGGPVRMVITPYGGLSLDADNEEDFEVLSQNLQQWESIDPVDYLG